jgi:hypothetical protein
MIPFSLFLLRYLLLSSHLKGVVGWVSRPFPYRSILYPLIQSSRLNNIKKIKIKRKSIKVRSFNMFAKKKWRTTVSFLRKYSKKKRGYFPHY